MDAVARAHGTTAYHLRRMFSSPAGMPLSDPMDTRILDRPAFRPAGHAVRVPLIHRGVNPHIQRHVAALPPAEHQRLKDLGDTVLERADDFGMATTELWLPVEPSS